MAPLPPSNIEPSVLELKLPREKSFTDGVHDDVVFRTSRELITSQHQKESFCLMDLSCVRERVELWRNNLPEVEFHYAVKANSDISLLGLLVGMGCRFDCASSQEIDTILGLGAQPKDIILANACKSEGTIEHAKLVGVSLMTFDCVEEAEKIVRIYPAAQLVLRIAVDDTDAPCPMGMKFGAPEKFWSQIIDSCKRLGVHLRGVSFHVGSGGCDVEVYKKSLRNAKRVFDMAKEKKMEPLDLLDIGGGFTMCADNEAYNFDRAAPEIGRTIREIFPLPEFGELAVIGEPGRLISQGALSMCTRIFLARQLDDIRHYFVDTGVYQMFSCHIFDSEPFKGQPLLPKQELRERCRKLERSFIWGQTCDGVDSLAKDKLMPRMEAGEWILYRNLGAYNRACASTFNGFDLPRIIYV